MVNIKSIAKERLGVSAISQEGIGSGEGSILFSEMLTDFERIGDHALNICDEMMNIKPVNHQ